MHIHMERISKIIFVCVPRHNGTARVVSGLIPILIPSVDHYWLGRVLGSRDSTLKD